MPRSQFHAALLVLLAICAVTSTAHALTIETLFMDEGQIINGVGVAESQPAATLGGGNLASIVRAAADVWEDLIADDHHITLSFGWAPTGSVSSLALHQGLNSTGEPRREVLGSLAFNSRYSGSSPLYLDPTPWVSEEFEFGQQGFANLGGGLVEVMRESVVNTGELIGTRDLYSTALHEIGHSLGLAGWSPFADETTDQDIDITTGAFAGTTIPVAGEHLAIEGPNMTNTDYPPGRRRDITQLDLLAVCQLSQFEACDLSLRPMFRDGDINFDGDVDGGDYLQWQRLREPNGIASPILAAWHETYGSPLYPYGDFNHDRSLGGIDFLAWQRGDSPAPRSSVDLASWQANYSPLGAATALSVIPEPGTFVLSMAALALGLVIRKLGKQ